MRHKTKKLTIIVGLGKTGISCVRFLQRQGTKNLAVIDSRDNPPGLSELKANFPNIPVHLGNFAAPFLKHATTLVVSPGVSLKEPALAKAIKQGARVTGDIELFCKHATAPLVAITGSNGKSTVTALVGAMAKTAALNVKVGGNFGTPALDLLDNQTEIYVLELSSFQLETTSSVRAAAAVILNISADHMDRYDNLHEYLHAKQRIYRKASCAVINRDDIPSFQHARLPKLVCSFGLGEPTAKNFGIRDKHLALGQKKLLAISKLKIKGWHQVANALAALALGNAIHLPMNAMLKTLRTFSGLPHRCQLVAKINRIPYYNDSKATNVGATKAALEGLGKSIKGKITLIAGGLGKDADFSPLAEPVKQYVKTTVLIGKDAKIIAKALAGCCELVTAKSMKQAIKICYNVTNKNDVVLLAPACASYDMFNNFEHRGEVFAKEVKLLKKERSGFRSCDLRHN